MYYDVLLPVPTGGVYTYISDSNINIGSRVTVPLGKRTLTGIVISENSDPDSGIKYRSIIKIPDDKPIFSVEYITFIKKMADYYCSPYGMTLRGVLSEKILASEPALTKTDTFERRLLTLNQAQESVRDSLQKHMDKGFSVHLVHGVTGSGKTEIFVELASDIVKSGRQVLYLVPEISLTPQMEDRLSARMGFTVPSYHSKKTPKKRKEAFWAFATNSVKMLLGARSALFLPMDKPGLIIVDEEHEASYKQEENPAYQLRDMAVLYAKILDIPVILSSATPSVESWQNTQTGKYHYHSIPCRPDSDMPDIEIIDMKQVDPIGGILSHRLYDEIYATISRGEQVILLINRKGYSHTLYCRKCGTLLQCSNCSVAVTYYKSAGACKCNYCSTEVRRPKCLSCGSDDIADYGAGTEKAAEVLESLFERKILRLDTESVTSYAKLSEMLADFQKGEYQIMAGTQLVAKGLDFSNVTLAGIINMDNIFALPDFRANERAYQLLLQLAGRAGRAEKKGRVIIQTNMPESDVFTRLDCLDTSFYVQELEFRRQFGYPPHQKMCRITLSHTKEDTAKNAAFDIYSLLKSRAADAVVFYPAQAPIYRIQNRFRYSIIIKSPSNSEITRLIHTASGLLKTHKSTLRLKVDRDPYHFM